MPNFIAPQQLPCFIRPSSERRSGAAWKNIINSSFPLFFAFYEGETIIDYQIPLEFSFALRAAWNID